ncbi:MAG: ornithine carbamoyltransferase [Spirochaetes bacterium]|jgi:ornithine carbamoyltransferase|nr:ornithine carbamoyltransferase [Spirochaetota bacterium]
MKIPVIHTKHLLKVSDLSHSEITELFRFTRILKKQQKAGKKHHLLKGKVLGMIFEKSSTRTRVSFETGIYQLGGAGLFLGKNDMQLGRGEPLSDTAAVLSRYIDGIMIRTFEHSKAEAFAQFGSVPVINGLTDDFHPCQALADYFTMYEKMGCLSGKKLTYIGDGNNMAHSLMLCGAMLGVNVSIATPDGFAPNEDVVAESQDFAKKTGATVTVTNSVEEASKDADVLYTDVWASMGQENMAEERKRQFDGYCITMDLIKNHAPNALVMHCLPAHRGEEVTAEVLDSEHSIILDEAENRLHVQKAVMAILMGTK